MNLKLRKARINEEDARKVMLWRNNPETLEMFYDQTPKVWESFWVEYQEKYFIEPGSVPHFSMVDGHDVGFLRANEYGETNFPGRVFDIDVNVAPSERGKGLGAKIIKMYADQLLSSVADVIVAEVKKQNIGSIKSFLKAGFMEFDETVRKKYGKEFEINRYIYQR